MTAMRIAYSPMSVAYILVHVSIPHAVRLSIRSLKRVDSDASPTYWAPFAMVIRTIGKTKRELTNVTANVISSLRRMLRWNKPGRRESDEAAVHTKG